MVVAAGAVGVTSWARISEVSQRALKVLNRGQMRPYSFDRRLVHTER